MIKIKKFIFNPIQENTYVLYDETKQCIIVDAGCSDEKEQKELTGFIESRQLNPVKLVNTHCHFDHIWGINYCRKTYAIPFYAHAADLFLIENAAESGSHFGVEVDPVEAPEHFLNEGDLVEFGNSRLELFHVPGHAPGSLVLYQPEQQFLMVGDVLFRGSIGRTDLPGGSYQQLVDNIHQKLMNLPDDVVIYSGHGPETTIGYEKKNNPFLIK